MTLFRDETGDAAAPSSVSVSTRAVDTLRATISIDGGLDINTVALLRSIARTHLTSGRRYLRIDLSAATVADRAAVAALRELHDTLTELGGSALFEHPDETTAALLNDAGLLVGPSREA